MKVKRKREGNRRRRIVGIACKRKGRRVRRTGVNILSKLVWGMLLVSLLVVLLIGETILVIFRFIITILLPILWGGVAIAVGVAFATLVLVSGIDAFVKGWFALCLSSYGLALFAGKLMRGKWLAGLHAYLWTATFYFFAGLVGWSFYSTCRFSLDWFLFAKCLAVIFAAAAAMVISTRFSRLWLFTVQAALPNRRRSTRRA